MLPKSWLMTFWRVCVARTVMTAKVPWKAMKRECGMLPKSWLMTFLSHARSGPPTTALEDGP